MIHKFRAPAVCRNRQAPANNFAKRGQITLHSSKFLSRPVVHPKSGNHFVDNEQRAVTPSNVSQSLQKSRHWLNDAHVGSDWLDDHRRDRILALRKEPLDCLQIIVRGVQGQSSKRLRNSRALRNS